MATIIKYNIYEINNKFVSPNKKNMSKINISSNNNHIPNINKNNISNILNNNKTHIMPKNIINANIMHKNINIFPNNINTNIILNNNNFPNNNTTNAMSSNNYILNKNNINNIPNNINLYPINNTSNIIPKNNDILNNNINNIPINNNINIIPNTNDFPLNNNINNSNYIFLNNNKNNNPINNINILTNNNNYTFPKGTKYEEELNANFRYFNVFWYDPNKSNDFVNFRKCFENVEFYQASDIKTIIEFFKTEFISEWIVVTPGSSGEELIKNLEHFDCIKTFFIFYENIRYHEPWAKKYNKVYWITSNPEILCQKFIELNKDYVFPKFDYKKFINKLLDTIIEINSKKLCEFNSPIVKLMSEYKKNEKMKYRNFCIKSLHYLNSNKFENDLANH